MKINIVILFNLILTLAVCKAEIASSHEKLQIDSLEQKLEFVDDSSKIEVLLNISWKLRNSEFQKSIHYGKQAIDLAHQYKDFENLTKANSFIGVAYRNLGDYTESFNYYFNGLNLARKHKLEEQEGYANINIGNLYVYQNNYKDAQEYLNNALIISENIGNKELQAYCLVNIGRVLIENKNFPKALIQLNKALTIRKEINDIRGQSVCYKFIGDVYNEINNYTLAMKNYEKSLSISEHNSDKYLLCATYNKISSIFLSNKNYENALEFAEKSLKTAQEIDSKLNIQNAYNTLAQIQRAKGNFKIVAKYQDYIIKYNDSLFTGQLADKMNYIDFVKQQLEYEQKLNKQTLIHNTEIHRQKQVRNYSIILTFILIIISVVIFMFFKIKQKTNADLLSKNKLIENQKTKLRELNTTKDKFLSIIAHDLKNPFNTLVGFSKLLLTKSKKFNEKEKENFIKMIYESSKNTLNLLENLLTWSKTQKGIIQYNPEQININNLIDDNMELLKPNALRKNITIINLIKDSTEIIADKEMINFIIRNLASNALKFTPQKGTIKIYEKKTNIQNSKKITIFIEDNGIGIASRNIENLFKLDNSYRTKGTDEETGTGLGLILCKEFINKHNGEIDVESKLGEGSIFHFSIPLQ